MGNIIWIVLAVVVVAAIIAFVMSRSGARKVEAQRTQAAEIREKAVEHDRRLREDEASATEADAKAQMARAEAQKRELEAERLAAEADTRSESADAARRERDEQLRLADLRDPDIETDDDGNRLDGHAGPEGERTREDLDTRDGGVRDADVRNDGARGDGTLDDGVRDDGVRDGRVDTLGRDDAPADRSLETTDERADTYEPRRSGTV
jgi:hypothetical protein